MKNNIFAGFTKKILPIVGTIFIALAAVSCDQNPIFYNISNEVKPKNPKIAGAPSKFVEFDDTLYVARRYIYSYGDGSGSGNATTWEKIANQPDGYVVDIAATTAGVKTFYALTIEPYKLFRTTDFVTWEEVSNTTSYPEIQGIHGTGNFLFAGGSRGSGTKGEKYAILCEDPTNITGLVSLLEELSENGRLTSVVESNVGAGFFYFATSRNGIYAVDRAATAGGIKTNFGSARNTYLDYVTGMILEETGNNILVVTSSGKICTFAADGTVNLSGPHVNDSNIRFNGALSIAKTNNKTNRSLMIGYESRTDSYSFGYREIHLNNNGSFGGIGLNVPGSFDGSSIPYSNTSQAEYNSSLGKHIVQSIIQTPDTIDSNMTLFASTYKEGLWSYRNGEWNAEE